MFRTLAFVAVWQHQRDAVDTAPLDFTGGNELVDHDLGTVGEIAKLGFPDHQGAGVVRRIAVFETEHGFFGQQRVDHDKRGLTFGDVLQRHIGAGVPLLALLVMDHRMAVREGAAAAVLAA